MQDELIYKLNMLKARFSYYAERHRYNNKFKQVVIGLINAVKNSPEKIFILRDFFEALIAFHKKYENKKNDQNRKYENKEIDQNRKRELEKDFENLQNVVNEIINDKTGDNLIKYTEKMAELLSEQMNSNQLRKIFEEIRKIKVLETTKNQT